MKYAMKKIQDVIVVELEGDMWGGWDTIKLKDTIEEMVKHGEKKFVVDLSGTKMVNSAGIGILIAAQEIVRSGGGTYKLCSVSERTLRAMAISEITGEFDIVADLNEALASLGIAVSDQDTAL